MHAQLTTPDGLVLMASRLPRRDAVREAAGILGVVERQLAGRRPQPVWERLADGATITMPLDVPPWGGTFGMLVDRFGVPWMLHGDPEE